jgi:hypothetical protein
MAFIGAALPYIAALGSAAGYAKQAQAAGYDAKVERNQADFSIDQANAQEGQVRRMGREALGRQAAAFGAAGVGYGGSSETSLDQSAVNQELDALNTRYKGKITGYGYGVQAGIDQSYAKQYGLMAGAALLKGYGSNYTYTPQTPYDASAGSLANASAAGVS